VSGEPGGYITISTTSNKVSTTAGPYPAKSYQYDASGNPTSDGTISYTYNDHGRMKSSVNAGIVTSYLYNALGQRVSKTSSQIASGGSEFIYDEEGRLLGEYDASGGLIQETVYLGATPVSVLKQTHTGSPAVVGTSVYYVYADHIATPRGITSATTGELVWSWANTDPFGMNGPSENPSGTGTFIHNGRFPGQYYDTETNLFHNGFRDYDPQTGRFIESDFIGLAGGINTYAYGLNNPVSNADPTGLYCVSRGGWTSCSVPNGPSFTVPTPPGFPNILGPGADPDYHHYDITRSLNGANADCVFDQITSNPTPGDKPNRATPRGATNNAVVLGQDNIVTSYLTHDAVTGAAVEVNIAGVGDGSLFGPGYVARYVAGWWAHTAGEGNNFKQSPAVTGQTIQDIANQALWGEQMSGFIKKCGCKK
jgi:RHS repeat-associated protein